MSLFLVEVFIPFIGMHHGTAWSDPHLFVVEADSVDQAQTKLAPVLPPEDPEVKEALLVQDGKDKYFDIKIR